MKNVLFIAILVCSGMAIVMATPTSAHAQCYLPVYQPSNTPTLSRTGGNSVSGRTALSLGQVAQGDWQVYLSAHLWFVPEGSSVWSYVTSTEGMIQIPNGTQAGLTFASPTVQATLQPRGNGSYQITLTAYGVCSGQAIPLSASYPVPSSIVSVRRPTLDNRDILGVWWFGEEGKRDPDNGYYDAMGIWGTPNWNGTLTYFILQGEDKVRLGCTSCNNTIVYGTAPSSGCALDVKVQAHLDGFYAESPIELIVNRPAGRVPDWQYYNSAIPGGYWSKDFFVFTDLCGYGMTSVAHHERFTGGYEVYWPDDVGSFWTVPPAEHGWTEYKNVSNTYDDIQRACTTDDCEPATVVPSGYTIKRRASSILRHPAWEFTDFLPVSLRRERAC